MTVRTRAQRPPRQRAFRAALLLLSLLLLLPTAHAADLAVRASAYRIDLGDTRPGEERVGAFTVTNPNQEPVRLHLVSEGDPVLLEVEREMLLEPGESREVGYRYRVPQDMQPGQHGEMLRLAPSLATAPQGQGTIVGTTAIMVTSRTASTGILSFEAPKLVLPGDSIAGRVIVANFGPVNITGRVALMLVGDNATLANATLGPFHLAAGASLAVPYNLTEDAIPPGRHLLVATVKADEPADAPVSTGGQTVSVLVGRPSATWRVLDLLDLRDGTATVRMALANTGNLPVTIEPRLMLASLDNASMSPLLMTLPTLTLEPGESRAIERNIPLPPGRFTLALENGASRSVPLDAASDVAADEPLVLTMAPAKVPISSRFSGVEWSWLVLLLALPVALVAAYRVRPRAARALATYVGARRREASWASDREVEAFLGSLEQDLGPIPVRAAGRALPVALLVDLPSLRARGAGADFAALCGLAAAGRPVAHAFAYDSARSEAEAAERYHHLQGLGFAPRVKVRAEAGDFRIDIAIEALRQARAGNAVVLVSHDPGLADLAIHLHVEGARVEVAGEGPSIPVGLREWADAVHEAAGAPRLEGRS